MSVHWLPWRSLHYLLAWNALPAVISFPKHIFLWNTGLWIFLVDRIHHVWKVRINLAPAVLVIDRSRFQKLWVTEEAIGRVLLHLTQSMICVRLSSDQGMVWLCKILSMSMRRLIVILFHLFVWKLSIHDGTGDFTLETICLLTLRIVDSWWKVVRRKIDWSQIVISFRCQWAIDAWIWYCWLSVFVCVDHEYVSEVFHPRYTHSILILVNKRFLKNLTRVTV